MDGSEGAQLSVEVHLVSKGIYIVITIIYLSGVLAFVAALSTESGVSRELASILATMSQLDCL